ncbi:hypothetical protein [Clostridium brassicae]|uniref:Transposase n=1 Tax=Clostridium brassicae TaxID=2999072 RepID=A0ABT4D9D9_9CLOT|nr:hypothetical protein [Clostridium brassicae]MCY6958902.1 hypothetical protein [Clostridium brassicae]
MNETKEKLIILRKENEILKEENIKLKKLIKEIKNTLISSLKD